jgi:hypothetical protein
MRSIFEFVVTHPKWSAWFLIAVGSFLVLEFDAYLRKTEMLTHTVRAATVVWPWTPWIFLALVLVLVLHFWLER